MEMPEVLNSKSVKGFIKGSLVLIGLFFVFSCGVAVLLFPFDKKLEIEKNIEVTKNTEISRDIKIDENIENKVFLLILVLIIPLTVLLIFFLIIFYIFYCLMKFHYEKLYDFLENEGLPLKIHDINTMIKMNRMVLKAKNIINKNIRRLCKIY